ncbi:MAG: hypothetical protein MH204_00470, partial [Fimbriimonadaceae bacterium]|nr:hypothetical protein [Fimbriimonadaceae bacterium]
IVATVLMILRYLGSPAFGSHGVRWLMNLSFLTALAVAAATAWEVKRSEGKRMLNTLNVINLLVPFAAALATFQRREAVYSLIVMVVVAYLYGFRFRAKHVLMGVAILYFFQFIIFPFVVAFRGEYKRLDIFGGQFGKAWTLFLDVAANGSKYNVEEASAPPPADWDARRLLYYDHRPSPTLDRYSLIIVTDAMKAATDTQGATGWQSIVEGSSMVIPRFLNPNKRLLGTSNELAQRVPGLAADTDRTTQISLGLMTEGYASFKLAGVFWVCFLCTFIMAMVLKVTTGDMLPGNLWSGSLVVFLPWVYSEATVGSLALSLFETQPLLLASGLFLILLANSLTRRPNRQQELIEEPATFETKSLRMSS